MQSEKWITLYQIIRVGGESLASPTSLPLEAVMVDTTNNAGQLELTYLALARGK